MSHMQEQTFQFDTTNDRALVILLKEVSHEGGFIRVDNKNNLTIVGSVDVMGRCRRAVENANPIDPIGPPDDEVDRSREDGDLPDYEDDDDDEVEDLLRGEGDDEEEDDGSNTDDGDDRPEATEEVPKTAEE